MPIDHNPSPHDRDETQSFPIPELESAGYAVVSNVGGVRTTNQDRFIAVPPLFAVADGMGGQAAGEVAAQIVVDELGRAAAAGRIRDGRSLRAVIETANRVVRARAGESPALRGMGTTCSALLIGASSAQIAHIGDSRVYLLRNGRLRTLTEDHTAVGSLVRGGLLSEEDAAAHPERHVLSRAIGADDNVDIDLRTVELEPDDRLLICSDGLSGMIGADEIERILAANPDPDRVAGALVDAALANGGLDNVTVAVIDASAVAGAGLLDEPSATQVLDTPERAGPAERRARPWKAILAAAVVVLLAAGVIVAQGTGSLPIEPPPASPSAAPSGSVSPSASVSPVPTLPVLASEDPNAPRQTTAPASGGAAPGPVQSPAGPDATGLPAPPATARP